MPVPNVGAVVDGYRFKGGNPNEQKNWELAPVAAPKPGTVSGGYVFKGGNPNDQKNWKPVEATTTPEKQKQEFAPSAIEEIPVVGGALSSLTDIPLGVATGVATIGKTFTDLFGADNAASDAIEAFGEGADKLRSAEAREDSAKDAEEMAAADGFWEGAGAAGRAFLRHPLDVTANLLGTAAPAAIAAAGAMIAAPASAATALIAAGGVGLASGVGMIKGSIYDATLARAKQAGLSETQAEKIAQEAQTYGGENTDMIALGGVIGAAASATGAGPLLGKMIANRVLGDVTKQITTNTAKAAAAAAAARATGAEVTEEVAGAAGKGIVRRGVEGFLVEGVPEGIQAGQEKLSENLAQDRAGFETDPMKGVLAQAGFEGTLGGILGGGLNVAAGRGEVIDKRQEQIDDEERRAIEIEAISGGVGKAYEEAVARYKSEGVSDREANLKAGEDIRAYMADRRNINEPITDDTTDAGGAEPSVPSGDGVRPAGMDGSADETDRGPVGTGGPTVGADTGNEGPQQRTLDEAKQVLSNKKIPLAERIIASTQLLNDTILNNEFINVNDIDQKQFDNAKKQLANGKYNGDPVAALEAVTGKKFTAPLDINETVAAPEGVKFSPIQQAAVDIVAAADEGRIPAFATNINRIIDKLGMTVNKADKPEVGIQRLREAVARFTDTTPMPETVAAPTGPTLDEVAKAPVADAIKAATQPDPASVVPGIAEAAAKDLGIAPEPAPIVTPPAAPQPLVEEPVVAEAAPTVAGVAPDMAVEEVTDTADVEILDDGGNWFTAHEGKNLSPEDADKLTVQLRERGFKVRSRLNRELGTVPEPAPVQKPVQKPVQPAPVEVTPEEELEEAPEDKIERVEGELEAAFQGVPEMGIEPFISEKTYNRVKFELKTNRRTIDEVDAELKAARERYESKQRYQAGRSGKAADGMAVADLVAHIADLTKNWRAKIGIKVIGTIDELPAKLRAAVERDGMEGVPAFVSPDGTIYFIANNIDTLEEASSAVYHESLGHLGLRSLFNTRLDEVLSRIYKSNKKLREQADQWTYDNPGVYANDRNPSLRALEEVLAEQSEAGRVDASVWAKISAVIKDFGRRIGLKLDYSDAEVRSILAMAHDQVIDGNSESTVIKGLRYMVNGWHGGPHDFEEFDSDKIGSGEGAQVYGWGLYFADKRGIAEHYRKALSKHKITVGGKDALVWATENLDPKTTPYGQALKNIERSIRHLPKGEELEVYIETTNDMIKDDLDYLERESDPETIKLVERNVARLRREVAVALRLLEAGAKVIQGGKLYEVKLTPEDNQFLLWDEPISKQSDIVKAAFVELGLNIDGVSELEALDAEIKALQGEYYPLMEQSSKLEALAAKQWLDGNRMQNLDTLARAQVFLDQAKPLASKITKLMVRRSKMERTTPSDGEDAYRLLAREYRSPKAASEALLAAGVRGTKYLDASSRSAFEKDQSFNYVIYDDADVEIINKYMAGKAKKKAETATVQRLKRKLATSHYAGKMSATAGDMFSQTRSGKEQIDLLDSTWKAMKNKTRRFVIGYLYYSRDLIRAISKLSPPVARKLSYVNETLHRMDGYRNIGLKTLTYNTLRYSKFNAKFKEGGRLLSDLINGSTLASVEPRHASLAAATAADIKLAGLVKEGASKTRIDNRKALIKEIYGMYEKLGTPEMGKGEGQSIYKMVMGGFERSFDNEYKAIVSNVRQSGLPADRIQQAVKQITEMYATAKQNAPYAPLFRTGQFWLRVGKGKNRRVFRFESEILYQQGMKDAVKWLQENGDKRSAAEIKADDKVFTFGRDIDGLEADFMRTEPSDVLKNVFQEIDKGGMADGAAIKDMIFQLYAASLPKGTLYEKMQHREGVEGFSSDTLRAYIDAQMATINRLTHLKYASKIRQTIGEAYGLMAGNPNSEQLQPYIDEMAIRVAETFSPDISKLDPLARLANKATFFYLLTSIKSALVQFLQLPTVALPALGARYGTVQAAAVAARYIATLGNKFGTAKVDEDGNIVTNWGQPTMGDSKYVNENKDPEMREALKYAWADARERGILDTTFAGDMVSRKSGPSADYQGRPAKISKWVFDFMSGGIHHAERIAREIAYMSAFELDYAMRRKGGMDHQTAMGVAADTAADLTLETMFDFSESSKPRAMKGPIGRVALQFYSFPIQIASMLTRTFLGTVSLLPNPERKVAAKQFFGIIGMTWMFAGTTGMPGYSFMMGLMTSLLAAAGLADDDDDEKGNNALTSRNLDLWFREKFLPEYFGPDSDLANDLGLEKEQAQDLTRAVKMGPLSAATNLNLGSSVGLDGLFFRDDTPVDTNEEALRSLWYTLSLGATGSVLRNFVRGGDYMMKGEWQRAAENLTPAPVRNALIAKRLGSEGYITPSTQDVVAPVEEYTWGKLVGQGIGFGRTDVSDIQKSNLLAKKTVDKIEKERADYINKLDKAYRDITLKRTDMKGGQEAINKVWKDIFKWNDNTDYISPIFLGNWQDSIGTRAEDRARSMEGLRVPKGYDPYVRGLLEKNR